VLQFLKAGIMEIPDVLVVTKADLGNIAESAVRDLSAALGALDAREVPVVAVSSLPPASGIDELIEALDGHRDRIDLPARRVRARRRHALADFAAEHGERGIRALGGRREAERFLDEQDRALDVPALEARLEERARAASPRRNCPRDRHDVSSVPRHTPSRSRSRRHQFIPRNG